jgi:hypothetical protein
MRYRSSSSIALACLALPALAQADVLVRFDASKGGCALLSDDDGTPIVKCDAAANPSVAQLSSSVTRKVVGKFVELRFPGAGEITLTPQGDASAPSNTPAGTIADASGAPVTTAGVLAVGTPGTPTPTSKDQPTSIEQALKDALKGLLATDQKFIQDKYDYSIPESPGFTIIGLTPEDVIHPRTLRDFVVSLKDGVDESGRFKTGIALDFTPFQWFLRDQSLGDYLRADSGDLDLDALQLAAKKVPKRRYFNSNMLANTSVSIGTSQGTGDADESLNLGIGLHVPLIDHSDGREMANECFGKTLFAKAQIAEGGTIPTVMNADEVNAATSECLTPRWNDTIWTASLGYATTSEDGSFDDTKSGAYGIWSSFAYGFDNSLRQLRDHAQLILHAKMIKKQTVQDPDDDSQLIEQDSETFGAAFKFGSDRLNAALQLSYSRLEDRTHDTSDRIQKLSVGLEYKLTKDLWLVATIGGEGGRANGQNNSFVLGSLKYGTAAKPSGDPRPK